MAEEPRTESASPEFTSPDFSEATSRTTTPATPNELDRNDEEDKDEEDDEEGNKFSKNDDDTKEDENKSMRIEDGDMENVESKEPVFRDMNDKQKILDLGSETTPVAPPIGETGSETEPAAPPIGETGSMTEPTIAIHPPDEEQFVANNAVEDGEPVEPVGSLAGSPSQLTVPGIDVKLFEQERKVVKESSVSVTTEEYGEEQSATMVTLQLPVDEAPPSGGVEEAPDREHPNSLDGGVLNSLEQQATVAPPQPPSTKPPAKRILQQRRMERTSLDANTTQQVAPLQQQQTATVASGRTPGKRVTFYNQEPCTLSPHTMSHAMVADRDGDDPGVLVSALMRLPLTALLKFKARLVLGRHSIELTCHTRQVVHDFYLPNIIFCLPEISMRICKNGMC